MVNIITILIEVLVFGAVIGTIATNILDGGNLSGGALALYTLVTLIIVAGFVFGLAKQMGLKTGR